MSLGLRGRVKLLESYADPADRFVDMAISLEICERGDNGPVPTGQSTQIGGRWDTWDGQYDPSGPSEVTPRYVTKAQWDYCLSDKFRITAAGGRGGGKSEALAQRCEVMLLRYPGRHGLVVSPDYAHTKIIWDKLLKRTHHWCLPGTKGIHVSNRVLTYQNGSTVRFLSADNPNSLRGWDAHWLALDEEKDISTEAIDIVMMCLRLADNPMTFGAGTPEIGEYYERYQQMEELETCEVFKFPSRENCFIPHAIFDEMVKLMDERRYRQEVEAEFVRMDEDAIVAKGFDRNLHKVDLTKWIKRDITKEYTKRKLRRSFSFIIGADYNSATPCVAWVYRVFEGNVWVVVDVIKAPDPAYRLAKEIKAQGYPSADCLVIDDASAEWQDGRGRRSPNSARRYMREHGFLCINPDPNMRKNPPVRARIDALTAKLAPLEGAPTWLYSERLGRRIWDVMENQIWATSGWTLDKTIGHDHDMDAATYPLHRLEPPAKISQGFGGVMGVTAK